jgi:hypothetical protein
MQLMVRRCILILIWGSTVLYCSARCGAFMLKEIGISRAMQGGLNYQNHLALTDCMCTWELQSSYIKLRLLHLSLDHSCTIPLLHVHLVMADSPTLRTLFSISKRTYQFRRAPNLFDNEPNASDNGGWR